MNNDIIKSMSQELNGMICHGGLFEKVSFGAVKTAAPALNTMTGGDTSPNTAGHVAGTLGGAALGSGMSKLVTDAIYKKVPSKALAVVGGMAALLPFVAVGSAAGAKIQQESRKSRREDMVMRELLKNREFRNKIVEAKSKGTVKISSEKKSRPGIFRIVI